MDLFNEGTFGFYEKFPELGDKVFIVICRHGFFHLVESDNKIYHYKYEPTASFRSYSWKQLLGNHEETGREGADKEHFIVDRYQRDLTALVGQKGRYAKRATKKKAKHQNGEVKETIKDFQQLVKDLDTQWKTPRSRNVGHVVYFPPIDKGNNPDDYTMGWALYEVEPSKIRNYFKTGHWTRTEGVAEEAQGSLETPTFKTRTNSSIRPADSGTLRKFIFH